MTAQKDVGIDPLFDLYVSYETGRIATQNGQRRTSGCNVGQRSAFLLSRDEFQTYFRRLSPAARSIQTKQWESVPRSES